MTHTNFSLRRTDMTASTVTITAEVDMPDVATDEDLLWVVMAALTQRDAMSRYGVIIDRGEK
jgi:hypothetical protein